MKPYILLLMLLCAFGMCTATAQTSSGDLSPSTYFHKNMKVWKTVDIGCYKNDSDLKEMIDDRNIPINDHLDSILMQNKIVTTPVKGKVDLVKVTLSDITTNADIGYDELCAEARRYKLYPCHPEVIVQLRLKYIDQPMANWVWVVTTPITYNFQGIRTENILALVNDGIRSNGIFAGGIKSRNKPFPLTQEMVFQLEQ